MTNENAGCHVHMPCGEELRDGIASAASEANMSSAAWCRMIIAQYLGIEIVQPRQGGARPGAGRKPRKRVRLPAEPPHIGRPPTPDDAVRAEIADLQRRGYPMTSVASLTRLPLSQIARLWT